MVGLKRRASDTLLPLRAPKQPRTTTHHPLGGNSTPSQNEALLARWKKLSVEFCRVVADTVACVARSFTGGARHEALPRHNSEPAVSVSIAEEYGSMPSPPPSPPLAPPPPATNAARKLPTRQPIPVFPALPSQQHILPPPPRPATAHHGHDRAQADHEKSRAAHGPYLSTYANMQTNAVASTSKHTLSGPQDPKVSRLPRDTNTTGLMSPPSSQESAYSIRSAVVQTYPEVAEALQQNPPRRRRKSGKQYIEREHIHAKAVSGLLL
ncbi:hypothetical protein C8Q76DRAFT_712203 [Earliella scabrosa]|nr:hypothetical protein C8Q76DRAFT_712203 [Earliella scabrosa]